MLNPACFAVITFASLVALPGCIFVPADTLENGRPNPNFMVGEEGSGKPIIQGRTSLIDAVDAMVIACSGRGGGPVVTLWHSPKARTLIVSYQESSIGWGISLNAHFPLFPMLLLGQRTTGDEGSVELEYNAAGIVTNHRRRSHDELRLNDYLPPDEYESVFGKEGAARLRGHAIR